MAHQQILHQINKALGKNEQANETKNCSHRSHKRIKNKIHEHWAHDKEMRPYSILWQQMPFNENITWENRTTMEKHVEMNVRCKIVKRKKLAVERWINEIKPNDGWYYSEYRNLQMENRFASQQHQPQKSFVIHALCRNKRAQSYNFI